LTKEKRRKRLVGVAGGVLATVGAVLIALLISTLGGHAGADFRVRLETDRTQVVRLGKAGLAVYIEELDGTSAANGSGYELTWTTSGGFVARAGATRAYWSAPKELGNFTITVRVRRAGVTRSATVVVESVDANSIPPLPLRSSEIAGFARAPAQAKREAAISDDGYVIDDIEFDKDSICNDDTVTITVRGHDPSGQSEWITPQVSFGSTDLLGDRVIAGLTPSAWHVMTEQAAQHGGNAIFGEMSVHLVVRASLYDHRTGAFGGAREVGFDVKPCREPSAGLQVGCQPRPADDFTDPSTYIACTTASWQDPAFHPVRVEWSVEGREGPPTKTTETSVVLAIPTPVQRGATSTLVIEATAYDATGWARKGRGTVTLQNPDWQLARANGVLGLPALFTARGRRTGEAAVMDLTLTNPFDEDVALSEIAVRRVACKSAAQGEPGDIHEQLAPAAVLGSARIGSGASISTTWRVALADYPCGAEAFLTGRGTASGLPAKTQWIMSVPSGDVVDDVARIEWLNKVRTTLEASGEWPANNQIDNAKMRALVEAGRVPPPVDQRWLR